MSQPKPFLPGAKYTATDVDFWRGLLDEYVPQLPVAWRVGRALPEQWKGHHLDWPHLISRIAWDNQPDHHGMVRWKQTDGNLQADLQIAYKSSCHAIMECYLQNIRIPYLPVKFDNRTFFLPETPVQYPEGPYRSFASVPPNLAFSARFLPVLHAEDGSSVVCVDVDSGTASDQGAVYQFPLEPLFRSQELIQGQADVARQSIMRFGQPLGCTLRDLLVQYLTPANAAELDLPLYSPQNHPSPPPAPFNWGPYLPPDIEPDQEGPTDIHSDTDGPRIGEHLDRIATKLAFLRHHDCFALRPTASKRYRPWPCLRAEDRASFERETGCSLPLAYAAFLMQIGNCHDGPGQGICKLEWSQPTEATRWRLTAFYDPNRLRRPFLHRRSWFPARSPKGFTLAYAKSHEQIDGTILLARELTEGGCQYHILLVANGAEAGHIWADQRMCGGGIVPLVRRGPYSFLYWYETWLDGAIAEFAARRAEQIRSVTQAP